MLKYDIINVWIADLLFFLLERGKKGSEVMIFLAFDPNRRENKELGENAFLTHEVLVFFQF